MKPILLLTLSAAIAAAQVTIPDGTKLRVRLDQTISSATAEQGQTVELSVTEAIKIDGQVVFPEGARVTGTVTEAREKARMGRAGKLDFSIDRVRASDGEWVPLRYTVNKKSGDSHAVRTGVLTAGVAVVFWPAAPVMLLMKGKDTTINKGVTFDTFTDQNHALTTPVSFAPQTSVHSGPTAEVAAAPVLTGTASVTVNSTPTGADIEVDAAFAGNTPTSLQLAAGSHVVAVKANGAVWTRNLQVTAGSTI